MSFRLPRFGIGAKILLGYGAAALLAIALAVYTTVTVERLHRLSTEIVDGDIIVADAADRMIESLLAQDAYARRSLVLETAAMSRLFDERGRELRAELDRLAEAGEPARATTERLRIVYEQYLDASRRVFEAHRDDRDEEAARHQETADDRREHLLAQLREVHRGAKNAQIATMGSIAALSGNAVRTTIVLAVAVVIGGALSALGIVRQITRSLRKLVEGTRRIARGQFDFDPGIRSHDEVALLSVAFRRMGKRLKRLEEMYLDASPLTGLPGGIAIETVLRKRLESGGPLAFCLVDLNHFKAFNDRYGYARGNDLIRATATLVEDCVRRCGGPDDFVGHIGGDDFAVITTWPAHETIARTIVEEFDRIAGGFYDPEDRSRGFIVTKTRSGEEARVPLMGVAVAVVTNQNRTLESHIQVGEIAAELKTHAKSTGRGGYVVDRREDPGGAASKPRRRTASHA